MDRLGSLNTFVQAAELRNFTSAGRRLGISSSAVGKTIARLEERLGVRLFVRSTRSVTLTAEGQAFLERCRRIFAEIEAAEAEMAQSNGVPAGRLRVSMPLTGMLLTPAISAFAVAHPNIELDIDFSDRLVDIVEEGFDVVLRTGAAADSTLMTRVLGTYSYVIVASPDYLARAGTPTEPEGLLSHACLHHRWSTTGKLEGWRLKRDGAYLDLALPTTLICSTIEPLIEMAERGLGFTAMPVFAVRRQLDEGRLVSVLDRYLDDVGTFRMMWPAGRQLLPRVRAFVNFMGEHLFAEIRQG
ncbi:LysR family transcriptional regulator [Nguyenibacter vanlangensis]|uniref:LysR family transcriptional regulator n=1 Tax=Nguyenibacter vanlangensis TaxID=1216886 RepID=A0A7Y7ISS0_9PROT|nr:LysR family transcriptional regulator [Nguyenibacter vanlangensis]NVN09632.1 LysR family transcriptional regulator [Nguyenibacter vanlangensis]